MMTWASATCLGNLDVAMAIESVVLEESTSTVSF